MGFMAFHIPPKGKKTIEERVFTIFGGFGYEDFSKKDRFSFDGVDGVDLLGVLEDEFGIEILSEDFDRVVGGSVANGYNLSVEKVVDYIAGRGDVVVEQLNL